MLTKKTRCARAVKHGGFAKHGKCNTPEYRTWCRMLVCCYNKRDSRYYRYGGRGIRVCKRWKNFPNFLADMRTKPTPAHTLDRIDNNGNYCKENCRWATRKEQARNTSRTVKIKMCGGTFPLSDILEKFRIPKSTYYRHVNYGVPEIEAIKNLYEIARSAN